MVSPAIKVTSTGQAVQWVNRPHFHRTLFGGRQAAGDGNRFVEIGHIDEKEAA